MSSPGKYPCHTTRTFDPTIHPKQTEFDVVTVRMQLRKHPTTTWPEISHHFKTWDWDAVWGNPRMCTKKGQTITASFRIRLANDQVLINLTNRRLYRAKPC